MSPENNLAADCKLLARSFMYIRTSNDPKIEPCGTQATTNSKLEN